MKSKINAYFCIMGLLATIIFSNCTAKDNYDFSFKDTLSVFLLKNGKDNYICIPIQYIFGNRIENFELTNGLINIGEYEILLKRDEVKISIYLKENTDEYGNSEGEFILVYLEENGKILVSTMNELLTMEQSADELMNYYYIFIEKYLNNDDMKKITAEYKKDNVNSNLSVWYDITIDNEIQAGNGMLDNFELYNGLAIDLAWFPQNLDFFKARYLQN